MPHPKAMQSGRLIGHDKLKGSGKNKIRLVGLVKTMFDGQPEHSELKGMTIHGRAT